MKVSYYGQKTFWSLRYYIVRSRKGIEIMVNFINIAYCAMNLLPYIDDYFFGLQAVQCSRISNVIKRRNQWTDIFYHFCEKHRKCNKFQPHGKTHKINTLLNLVSIIKL